MFYSTSNTYQMIRKILNFANKFSKHLSKPERKFTADMTYGMLASNSCLLTNIVDHQGVKNLKNITLILKHFS
ncbi:MAG: hypothetical protein K2K63_10620 [Acetatifactor sp.]|nr:hypothetical protein [Acetatifactor sp.]